MLPRTLRYRRWRKKKVLFALCKEPSFLRWLKKTKCPHHCLPGRCQGLCNSVNLRPRSKTRRPTWTVLRSLLIFHLSQNRTLPVRWSHTSETSSRQVVPLLWYHQQWFIEVEHHRRLLKMSVDGVCQPLLDWRRKAPSLPVSFCAV